MRSRLALVIVTFGLVLASAPAQIAGTAGADELIIAQDGKARAGIVVAADAGKWEKQAATDLAKYIGLMSGGEPRIVSVAAEIDAALKADAPVLLIGQRALAAEPSLAPALAGAAKKNPTVRADAIVVKRVKNRVYLAGTNDESHYFAASWLLQQWGCRWYLAGDFGECIPSQPVLKVGALEHVYAPPFEVRHYWLSWNGDSTGAEDFQRRNFMSSTRLPGMGHALGEHTKALIPPGKSMFNVPFSEPKTAETVAASIEPHYAKGEAGISIAIEDGNYVSDSARDKELQAGILDKYTLQPSNTDGMMSLYNSVAKLLRTKHPASKTLIGGMAYANVTIPPQQMLAMEPNLVMWLAPIDIDPNHGMDDPLSPPRQEYCEMMYRWAELMKGRVVIYDYDQGQLVWRDLPNPSHDAFAQDVKHYRNAGILGVGTESRGAAATTFLNLFFRGQLMWNPDADVAAQLAEFYPKFYGPAAAPMAKYWTAIYDAWKTTPVTEHEYFVAPAIYTPELVASLKISLAEARKLTPPGAGKPYLDRIRFTELGFEVLDAYMAMVRAANAEVDYKTAVTQGDRGLAAREELTKMNGIFTTYKKIGENGASWWPGEVQQYRDLLALTDGTKGTLVAKTPLEWTFRADPHDTGLARGWGYKEPTKSESAEWKKMRADLYLQAQGVLHPDGQSYTGHYWYRTGIELKPEQTTGKVSVMFPGLFNECWLYVNGALVAHRNFKEPWWLADYKFEWPVDLTGHLKAGQNTIVVRGINPHHFGGMFRRPFLYRPAAK